MRDRVRSRNRIAGRRASKTKSDSSVGRSSQRRKTKHFRVLLVRQVIDPAEDREMGVEGIFRCEIYKRVVFDIEIRSAKIQFLPCVDKDGFRGGAQLSTPEIRAGKIYLVPRPSGQTCAWQLGDVGA